MSSLMEFINLMKMVVSKMKFMNSMSDEIQKGSAKKRGQFFIIGT